MEDPMSVSSIANRQSSPLGHKKVDEDQDVSFAKMMAPAQESKSDSKTADVAEASSVKDTFQSADRNHDGFVSSAELGGQLGGGAAHHATKTVDEAQAAAQAIASYVKLGPEAGITSQFAATA
jgi:hypothetical protein